MQKTQAAAARGQDAGVFPKPRRQAAPTELRLREAAKRLSDAVAQFEGLNTMSKAWLLDFCDNYGGSEGSSNIVNRTNNEGEMRSSAFSARANPSDAAWTALRATFMPMLQELCSALACIDHEDPLNLASGGLQNAASSRPVAPGKLLSLRDYAAVNSALELVVFWGLAPLWAASFGGVAVSKRSQSRSNRIPRRVLLWVVNELAAEQKSGSSGGGRLNTFGNGDDSSRIGGGSGAYGNSSSVRSIGGGGEPLGRQETAVSGAAAAASAAAAAADRVTSCADILQDVLLQEHFAPMLLPTFLPDIIAARWQAQRLLLAAVRPAQPQVEALERLLSEELAPSVAMAGVHVALQRGRAAATEQMFAGEEGMTAEQLAAARQLPADAKTPADLETVGNRSAVPKNAPVAAPVWLTKAAGGCLSRLLLRPGGVEAALELFLGSGRIDTRPGAGGSGVTAAVSRAAQLLASVPHGMTAASYVEVVAPQLRSVLMADASLPAVAAEAVVLAAARLSRAAPAAIVEFVLRPLLWPVLLPAMPAETIAAAAGAFCHCTGSARGSSGGGEGAGSSGDTSGSSSGGSSSSGGNGGSSGESGSFPELASEADLAAALRGLERLLLSLPAPPPLVAAVVSTPIVTALFLLYLFCAAAKAALGARVAELLRALLDRSPRAVQQLRDALLAVAAEVVPSTVKAARFAPGSSGGVAVRLECQKSSASANGISAEDVGAQDLSLLMKGLEAIGSSCRTSGSSIGSGFNRGPEGPSEEIFAAAEALGLESAATRLVLACPEGAATVISMAAVRRAAGVGAAAADILSGNLPDVGVADSRSDLGGSIGGVAGSGGGGSEPVGSAAPGWLFYALLSEFYAGGSSVDSGGNRGSSGGGGSNCGGSTGGVSGGNTGSGGSGGGGGGGGDGGSGGGDGGLSSRDRKSVLAAVAHVLLERLGPRLLDSGLQVLRCIALVVMHEAESCEASASANGSRGVGAGDGGISSLGRPDGTGADETDDDGITLCGAVLGLLLALLEAGEEQRLPEEEAALRELLPPLQRLAGSCHDAEAAALAAEAAAAVVGRQRTPEQRQRHREHLAGSLGERSGDNVSWGAMLNLLESLSQEMGSPAVPVRACCVVTLTRPVREVARRRWQGGPSTSRAAILDVSASPDGGFAAEAQVIERYFDAFLRMVGDKDSYVYLAAVQGLAAMADAWPDACLPALVSAFTSRRSVSSESKGKVVSAPTLPLLQRLKVGDALMFAARRCGDAMPRYARYFINALVLGARERNAETSADSGGGNGKDKKSPLGITSAATAAAAAGAEARAAFRASCLTNLCEVCELLRWAVRPYLTDLVDLALGVLTLEATPASTAGRAVAVDKAANAGDRERGNGAAAVEDEAEDQYSKREEEETEDEEEIRAVPARISSNTWEEAAAARRGAALLLSGLTSGCGDEVLQLLGPDLKRVYRALRVAVRDPDAATRSHAQVALNLLGTAVKGQMGLRCR